ncbi:hypothetical protein [Shewanella algae]|uniref:hypothetical protein n=1 Tax=Shewanella algae TaxID=38313 RepID=UPI001BEE271A|nr:hypothetical protein [Shewanella algae]BCV28495.1 hypothetical protein TUM3811_23550 [Shewanella algae]
MTDTKTMSSVKSQILGLTKTVYSFDYNGQTVHFKLPTIKQTAIFNSENPNYHTDSLIALLVNETGVVDQIIRLNATAPRLSAALRDFLANRHTQSYDFV